MLDVEQLLHNNGLFPKSKKKGRYYLTCPKCSASRKRHNQKKHCLSLMIEDERAYWKCHHCGWSGPEKGSVGSFSESTRYEYPGGNYKVRKPGGFVWEHEDADGTVHTGSNGLGPALYRLEEARETGGLVAVVEGEKDAETLWRFGIPAVTSPHGAAKTGQVPKWTPEHSAQLKGLDIVVLNDNDEPGYAHAKAVVDNSIGVAKSVRRLDLALHWTGMPDGADISDFIAERANYDDFDEQLRNLLRNAPLISGTRTMAELMTKTFAELKWVVPRYIPEGCTLLSGKPKIGKSWLVLATALACVRGDNVLGEQCPKRRVLYCALEDNERRLNSRIATLTSGDTYGLENMLYVLELPRLDRGCAGKLKQHIQTDQVDLIIIDTLAAIASPKIKDETQYAADYRNIQELTKISIETGVPVIVVHHVRKQGSDDVFEMISGTMGIAAAADHLMVLTREGDQLRMATRGRDAEPEDKTVDFDSEFGLWTVTGDYEPADQGMSNTRQTILAALGTEAASMTPAEVAKMTGVKVSTVQGTLRRMAKDGQVKRTSYGSYHV